jgi:hypothetical protein
MGCARRFTSAKVPTGEPGSTFTAGDPVPADIETATGFIVMHLPEARFDSVVDLLRNEHPLFISLASGIARLSTRAEQVGEQEG